MKPEDLPEYATSVESVFHPQWPLPLWLAILFSISAASFCVWLYLTERGHSTNKIRLCLAAIRFALLLTILWMLAGWSWIKFKTQQPELAIVLDVSASMSTEDVLETDRPAASRIDRAIKVFSGASRSDRRALQSNYQISWFGVAESLERIPTLFSEDAVPPSADGPHSRLGESLGRLLARQAGRGTAAIVFLSDGINTAGPGLEDVAKMARTAAIPFYTVSVGRQLALPDVRLADPLFEKEVYFGDRVTVDVSVIASDFESQSVAVTLRAGDVPLDEQEVALSPSSSQQTARLSFVPEKPGAIDLRLSVSPLRNESELANNELQISVVVQDKSLRVLLVHDQPSYEFRFLKHLLERSTQAADSSRASFELRSVLQDSDPVYTSQDRSAIRLVPSDQQQLSEFDVFVFGHFDPALVSRRSQQSIVEAVTEGGAGCIFVFGSGSPGKELAGWPLGDLLPVLDDAPKAAAQFSAPPLFSWRLTTIGKTALPMQLDNSATKNQRLWQQLPPFRSTYDFSEIKVGAQVLAEAVYGERSSPVLVVQYAGAGRVALQAMDETYLWTTFGGSDLYHQRYWGQMLRWLSRGKLNQNSESSEIRIEPAQAKFGQPIRFEVTLGTEVKESELPGEVELNITNAADQNQRVVLQRSERTNRIFHLNGSKFRPGQYRALLVRPVTDSQPSKEFTVRSPPGEQANLRADVQALRSLAERSRGRFYTMEDADSLLDDLPPGTPTRLGNLPPIPIWNHSLVALWFVLLITGEWILRRYARML